MKKLSIITALILILSITFANANPIVPIKGNGEIAQQEYEIENFTSINIDGVFNVEFVEAENSSIQVEADQNLLEILAVTVSEKGELSIDFTKKVKNVEHIKVYLAAPNLEEINLSGVATFNMSSTLLGEYLAINTSGLAAVKMDVNVADLTINADGLSKVIITGNAAELTVKANTNSMIDAIELETASCQVNTNGVSVARLNVTNTFSAEALGTSMISFKGNPSIESMQIGRQSKFNKL